LSSSHFDPQQTLDILPRVWTVVRAIANAAGTVMLPHP
jgi:hypothetical protein